MGQPAGGDVKHSLWMVTVYIFSHGLLVCISSSSLLVSTSGSALLPSVLVSSPGFLGIELQRKQTSFPTRQYSSLLSEYPNFPKYLSFYTKPITSSSLFYYPLYSWNYTSLLHSRLHKIRSNTRVSSGESNQPNQSVSQSMLIQTEQSSGRWSWLEERKYAHEFSNY